jgi:hypothetical protein
MRTIGCLFLLTCCMAVPATAQVTRPRPPVPPREPYPMISPRGFVTFSQQKFAAQDTFEAVFGESVQPFRGGGADVVVMRNFFGELSISRFEQTGQRVYRFGGETFPLGIPLTAKVRPIEVTGGYRLTQWRRVIPYAGIGYGSYRYEETSDFSTDAENVNVTSNGIVLVGGAEVRVMRWVGITVDVRKTTIDDIIGAAGVSKEFNESDLGGTAFRFRIMVGR